MANRISITISDQQNLYIGTLSQRMGTCPTAYVNHLVVADINRNLDNGILDNGVKRDESERTLIEFVRSLVSDDGVDMNVVKRLCKDHNIPLDKMSDVLGFNDLEVPLNVDNG